MKTNIFVDKKCLEKDNKYHCENLSKKYIFLKNSTIYEKMYVNIHI